jgi:hypothetical protein
MQRIICELLKEAIIDTGLAWLDSVNGMVEPLQIKVGGKTSVITKTIPVYRNPSQTGCKKGNDYTECVPRTALKSLVYLEPDNPSNNAHTGRYDEFDMTVKIILWLNLKQLNIAEETAANYADELMGNLPHSLANLSPYNTIRVDIDNCERNLSDVNKYTYDEAESQMWIYPFDFSVISMKIRFRRTNTCHATTVSNPSVCKIY